jgi:hypothetical protein
MKNVLVSVCKTAIEILFRIIESSKIDQINGDDIIVAEVATVSLRSIRTA